MPLTYERIVGMSYAELAQLCIQLLASSNIMLEAKENPEMWLRVVNDVQIDPRTRTLCLIQFFLRHAFGRKVVDVVQTPGLETWFSKDKIVFPVYKGGITLATTKGTEFRLIPKISSDNDTSLDLSVFPTISEDKFFSIVERQHCPCDLEFAGVGATEFFGGEYSMHYMWIHPSNHAMTERFKEYNRHHRPWMM